ncbi:MAG TPA: hypothetical protein DDW76_14900 [Cyanobacteria bacterium UBA11369]|nr:hypothetical protein [Cyanobacteria bacterium UBA11371]HBE16301.1 hypothetical protein [Cyanobacteria bacterium UBA11367]HBE36114.1 hypothetical protein [Cyanobacteria bacterium UBA11368]HBE50046.1 hypothetical protein [Cyanobacteria bacterium UBA11369]
MTNPPNYLLFPPVSNQWKIFFWGWRDRGKLARRGCVSLNHNLAVIAILWFHSSAKFDICT